jgi:hypothetical protein
MATKLNPSDSAQTLKVINVTNADSPYTLDRDDCPCFIHNLGTSTGCIVNLPTNAKGGEEVYAVVIVAQDIAFEPGAKVIYSSNGTTYAAQTAGFQLHGDAIGEAVHMVADSAGNWWVLSQQAPGGAGAFTEVVNA